MVWNRLKAELFFKQQEKMSLYQKLRNNLPNTDELKLKRTLALAGLLTSVAFSDLKMSQAEKMQIESALKSWSALNPEEINLVTLMSEQEIKELSALETHFYTDFLANHLTVEERYHVLLILFSVAAASEGVSVLEAEEIRVLCKGLLLEHKHFIAAQSSVKESLNSLKG